MPRFLSPVLIALWLIASTGQSTALAQESWWSVGLKPGVALSQLSGDDADHFNMSNCRADDNVDIRGGTCFVRTGASVGGFLSLRLTPTIAIQPEFYYVQRGGEYSLYYSPRPPGFPVGELITFTRVLDYIEIPLLLRWRQDIGIFRLAVPTAHIGPTIAFNLESQDMRRGEGGLYQHDYDLTEYTNSIEYGIAFGGGVDILLLGPGAIVLEGRFTLGLSEVGPAYYDRWPKEAVSLEATNIFNRSFSFHIGYGYPF